MAPPWIVNGTKKGALPIKVEKRPKGKTVTILSNVHTGPQALLTQLQRCLGTGGKLIGNGMIEVQGSHEKRLTQFLLDVPKQLKGIKGLSASTKQQEADAAAAAAAAAQAASNAGSSRRSDKPRHIRRDKEGEKVFAAEQQAREEYNLKTKGVRRLCPADWPYCSGGCIDHHDELEAGIITELPDTILEADQADAVASQEIDPLILERQRTSDRSTWAAPQVAVPRGCRGSSLMLTCAQY